jgi:hypothetical protein
MKKHLCKREKICWNRAPNFDGDCISFKGTCSVCGKEWEQVFAEVEDGLWDVENEEYVII